MENRMPGIKVMDLNGGIKEAFEVTGKDDCGNWLARDALQKAFDSASEGGVINIPNGTFNAVYCPGVKEPRLSILSLAISHILTNGE